jgi:hypothetical protein
MLRPSGVLVDAIWQKAWQSGEKEWVIFVRPFSAFR